MAVLVVHISRPGGKQAIKGPVTRHALPSAICCGIMPWLIYT